MKTAFTSKQRKPIIDAFLCFHVYVYPCCLKNLVDIKIEIESRHHCIDIYDDDCRFILIFVFSLLVCGDLNAGSPGRKSYSILASKP